VFRSVGPVESGTAAPPPIRPAAASPRPRAEAFFRGSAGVFFSPPKPFFFKTGLGYPMGSPPPVVAPWGARGWPGWGKFPRPGPAGGPAPGLGLAVGKHPSPVRHLVPPKEKQIPRPRAP